MRARLWALTRGVPKRVGQSQASARPTACAATGTSVSKYYGGAV
ncbi:hypothetical protein [Cryobacterium sp. M15]|nr:hypothetical protein [Cryobacterium sp. M15]